MTLAACFAIAIALQTPPSGPLRGVVRDATGLPLAGVSVEIAGALVAVSDVEGRFEVPANARRGAILRLSLPGFEPRRLRLSAISRSAPLVVILDLARIADEVTVSAPPAPSAERPFELAPLDAYRTPGTAADLFRSLRAMAGASEADDGAGLFVRGGDVSEVLVSLDGATMAHPYRYETPTGGFRGAIDPFNISGLAFSTGGFGARYGNALSAVVDMHGLGRPDGLHVSGTAGLAGVAASAEAPLGRLGARVSANRTLTDLLFAVNRQPRHFDPAPDGWDLSSTLTWNGGRAGTGRVFVLSQRDRVGVDVEEGSFTGLLRSSSLHDFATAKWNVPAAGWNVSGTWGSDRYERGTQSGVLDLALADGTHSWRIEGQRQSGAAIWIAGANGAVQRTTVEGQVPTRGGDLGGVSGESTFSVHADDWFAGTFVEAAVPWRRVTAAIGVRTDRFSRVGEWTLDPRFNARIVLHGAHSVRVAAGLYHQAPAPGYLDSTRGATALSPMRATHVIAGYELGTDFSPFHLRVEAYRKRYRDLPLEADRGYSSEGYGWASGVDAFLGWSKRGADVKGIVSWLDARRRWTPIDQQAQYPMPDGTWRPDFDIPWSVGIIALAPLRHDVSAGGSWRRAAGRPFTPVLGATETPRGFVPIYGSINSGRLPRYERLDLSISWMRPAAGGLAILFASVDNALGRGNFFEYAYSPDYAARRPVLSAAPRSVYAGLTFRR